MLLSREQCISLIEKVSGSGIDIFEIHSGEGALRFNRHNTAGSPDGYHRNESGQPTVVIQSPKLGMCRTALNDDAPPYVQEGQMVSEDDVICSIDVLGKQYNVVAGTRGIIVRLNTRHGELVEYKQQLAVIQTV